MRSSNLLPPVAVGKFFQSALLTIVLLCAGTGRAWCAEATAHDYEGTYAGTYTANQGITRAVLVIEARDDTNIDCTVIFFADKTNRSVPSGAYFLTGKVDAASGDLVLKANKWLDQPENYIMLDLRGSLSEDKYYLKGKLFYPADKSIECPFKVHRITRMPQ